LFAAVLVVSATPLLAQSGQGGENSEESLFRAKDEQVPVAKFVEKSSDYLVEMRAGLSKGLDLLKEAREEKDALRLQCVNDKITSMKGVLRISEDSSISLQEAMATRATEKARYEFNKIRTSRNKMAELVTAAQNCVGAEATFVGDPEVLVEIDPDVVIDDPYYGVDDPFYTPEDSLSTPPSDGVGSDEPPDLRPPYVSVYQGAEN
jgi:hypothetical protein